MFYIFATDITYSSIDSEIGMAIYFSYIPVIVETVVVVISGPVLGAEYYNYK